MNSDGSKDGTPKWMRWTGRVISAVPVLFMGVMGAVMLVTSPNMLVDQMKKYGYPEHVARPIVVAEIVCAVVYAIPQTAVLGAILLTGYLGGAVATHVHAGEPFYFPVLAGVLVWIGLVLRDARVRALLPLRRLRG
jgi:hypothetical protein